jgi:hypothetical protein
MWEVIFKKLHFLNNKILFSFFCAKSTIRLFFVNFCQIVFFCINLNGKMCKLFWIRKNGILPFFAIGL